MKIKDSIPGLQIHFLDFAEEKSTIFTLFCYENILNQNVLNTVWIFQVHLIFFFSGCSTHRRFVKNVRLPTIYNRLTMWTGILRMRNSSEYLWTDNNTWIILDVNGSKANDSFPNSYSSRNILIIFVYTVLFTIAAVGNLTVFVSLFRSRHRKSRISLMIRHLAIADLIVTFVMIPIEVSIFSIFIFVT